MSDEKKPGVPTVECATDGPYLVKGLNAFYGIDGEPAETKAMMALCRCGATKNRPFCDGTHSKIGFKGDKAESRVADKRETYVGKSIAIHDNRGLCSHAGYCTDKLKQVFRSGAKPWIDPDGAAVAEITKVIQMCPSGALSYSVDGKEFNRSIDDAPKIQMSPHGPLELDGGVVLKGVPLLEGAPATHATLCRCGQSKNKPFCDGSHWYANFRDDGKFRIAMLSELEDGKAIHVEVKGEQVQVLKVGDRINAKSPTGTDLQVTVEPRWGEVLITLAELHPTASKPAKGAPSASAPNMTPNTTSENREEPHNAFIQHLAQHGLSKLGSHGPMAAMGVPRYKLPLWDDLQFLTAQLHKLPLLEDQDVGTELVVGPKAKRPLTLKIPIIVSDMSFGALSFESKVALATGAELAGTGICSGEGGMLPEEQQANSRYFYELASAKFGFSFEQLTRVQAFHFKGGQGAKTGTGGHLPGEKVTEKIAAVRRLKVGQSAISPPRFLDLETIDDFKALASQVRDTTGGIPIGFKLSAQHIEKDIDAALEIGVDYLILDGRGGGTGAAPLLFRDNISVPTIPALARARRHLDSCAKGDVTLFITGGLRTPADFAKALALGADGVAISNSALQAIGCVGSRQCHTNTCPAGIATQDPTLRQMIVVEDAAARLARFLDATIHLMVTLARACGHRRLADFSIDDLTTFKREMADLSGVRYAGLAVPTIR